MTRPSLFGTDAAIRAARYHFDRATSPGLKFYWQMVIDSLERKQRA